MTEIEKALDKIKKCLALSRSSNSNEASIALKQAYALMKKYNLDSEQVELSCVKEYKTVGANAQQAPRWYWSLCDCIEQVFGVKSIHQMSKDKDSTVFIGIMPNVQIASYIFEVVYRRIKKERSKFIKETCQYSWRGDKTRKGDVFAENLLLEVSNKIVEFTPDPKQEAIIKAYMGKQFPKVEEAKPRDAEAGWGDMDAIVAGRRAGLEVNLYHGVNGQDQLKIGSAQHDGN